MVVFFRREGVTDIYSPQVISHIDHQPIFLPTDIENRAPLPQKAGRREITTDLMRGRILLLSHHG